MRGRKVAFVLFVAVALAATAGVPGASAAPPAPAIARAASTPEEDWLGRVNAIREASGLAPATENPSWTAGILAHLRYLAGTPASMRTGTWANAHTENPESPYYTPEGAKEAESSDLTYQRDSNLDAINSWLTAPFHAIGLLRPGLQQVAFARDPTTGDAGIDVINGFSFAVPSRQVLYPGPDSTIDLPRFGGESPTPIETCEAENSADYSRAGLPLIALLTAAPQPSLAATLTAPDGSTTSTSSGDLCVVTSDTYVSRDSIYGPEGREILEGDNAVLVIPATPLTAGRYTVDIQQPGEADIAWSFNSQPPPEPRQSSRRLRVVRLRSRARRARGGWTIHATFAARGAERMVAKVGRRAAARRKGQRLPVVFFYPRRRRRLSITVIASNGESSRRRIWVYRK